MTWHLRTNTYQTADLHGDIQRSEKSDLIKLGLKRLLLFWLGAVLSLPIVGLHFVLVPAFFLAGFFSFRRSLHMKFRIVSAEFECPECHRRQTIANIFINEDSKINCRHCQTQLTPLQE